MRRGLTSGKAYLGSLGVLAAVLVLATGANAQSTGPTAVPLDAGIKLVPIDVSGETRNGPPQTLFYDNSMPGDFYILDTTAGGTMGAFFFDDIPFTGPKTVDRFDIGVVFPNAGTQTVDVVFMNQPLASGAPDVTEIASGTFAAGFTLTVTIPMAGAYEVQVDFATVGLDPFVWNSSPPIPPRLPNNSFNWMGLRFGDPMAGWFEADPGIPLSSEDLIYDGDPEGPAFYTSVDLPGADGPLSFYVKLYEQ